MLSDYDIKRIAAELASIQSRELSTKVTKALNQVISEHSDEFLTTAQACRFLKITERQIHKLKAAGIIPYSKPSRLVYFRKSALIAYMDNKK